MSASTGNAFPGSPALSPAASGPRAPARPSAPRAVLVSGNRCEHAPAAPRFAVTLPEDANPARPALIAKAIAKACSYYRTPRDGRWDALSQGERYHRLERRIRAAGGPGTVAGRVLARRLARWRQQRSERREAVVAVLALLLHYTDIATLTVAVPRGGDWLGLSAPWIAGHTGLSASRVKRALATLARSGWLANTGRGHQFDRRRRCWVGIGWGPVRRLSFHLIRALGLEVSWNQARRKASKRDRHPLHSPPSTPATDTRFAPILDPALPRPAPSAAALESQRAHARALRRELASPAARRAEADPTGHQAAIDRNRRLAGLVAEGLSLTEARQRLNDAPQPP